MAASERPPTLQSAPKQPNLKADEHQVVTTCQVHALAVLTCGAVGMILWLALPVGTGILIGVLLAFVMQPAFDRLRRLGWSGRAAGLFCSVLAATVVTITVAGVCFLVVARGLDLVASIPELFQPFGKLRHIADHFRGALATFHLTPASVMAMMRTEAVSLSVRAAPIAAVLAGVTFGSFLTLLMMALTTHFVLCNWTRLASLAARSLPFEPRRTYELIEHFRHTGRHVLLGTVFTGILQGLFATFGYWLANIEECLFFGILTAFASLVPVVGTLLVWVPVSGYLIVIGQISWGLFLLTYCAVMVSISADYVIRPLLLDKEKELPSLFAFVALFGGAEVFGLIGLILGPLIVSLSLAVFETYRDAQRGRRAVRSDSRPT